MSDKNEHKRRAAQERRAAEEAATEVSAAIHRELAQAHERLAAEGDEAPAK